MKPERLYDPSHYNGCISADIDTRTYGGKTESYIARQYYKLPLQIMPPFYQDNDGTLFLYLLNPCGGILERDSLLTDFTLQDSSRACITTPASTKIYKQKSDCTSEQTLRFTLKENTVLEYLPDFVIPFADSSYRQETTFYLTESSRLIAFDSLAAGRIADNEVFRFHLFDSSTQLLLNDIPIASDHAVITPGLFTVQNTLAMRNYSYISTIYAYAPECNESLLQQIKDLCSSSQDSLFSDASMIDQNLIIIKVLGSHAYQIHEFLTVIWNTLRMALLQKTAVSLRKY